MLLSKVLSSDLAVKSSALRACTIRVSMLARFSVLSAEVVANARYAARPQLVLVAPIPTAALPSLLTMTILKPTLSLRQACTLFKRSLSCCVGASSGRSRRKLLAVIVVSFSCFCKHCSAYLNGFFLLSALDRGWQASSLTLGQATTSVAASACCTESEL